MEGYCREGEEFYQSCSAIEEEEEEEGGRGEEEEEERYEFNPLNAELKPICHLLTIFSTLAG